MEPILTHTFDYSRLVTCGKCKGEGIDSDLEVCSLCGGSGELMDVRKGTMSLYPVKKRENEKTEG